MISPFQILTFLIYAVGMVVAIYFSCRIADDGFQGFIGIASLSGTVVWLLFGGGVWWLPVFLGNAFASVFWFGFKIYAVEFGLLFGLLAVLPVVIMGKGTAFRHRERVPPVIRFLLLYLLAHAAWSCLSHGGLDIRNAGSIFRIYLVAIWGPLIVLLFRRHGSTRHIGWLLLGMEITFLVRLAFDVAGFFWPSFLYLPGINLVLPGSTMSGIDDARWAGLGLAQMAVALLFAHRGLFSRAIHIVLLVGAGAGVMLGGSRGVTICYALCLLTAAIYARKRVWIGVVSFCLLAVVVVLNVAPHSLDIMPERFQRAASILVLQEGGATQIKASLSGTYGTDDWHSTLRRRAIQDWTANPLHFAVGNGIQPFDLALLKDVNSDQGRFENMVQQASVTGSYEAGFARVVGVLGLAGLLLYAGTFWVLLRRIARLREAAAGTRYGHALRFLSLYLGLQWIVICYLQGDFPSFEIAIMGITLYYLQDQARLQEEAAEVPDGEPSSRA